MSRRLAGRALVTLGGIGLVVAAWGTATHPVTDGYVGVVVICLVFSFCGAGLLTLATLWADPTCTTCGRAESDDHYDAETDSVICPDADPAPVHQWDTTEPVGYAERDTAASDRAAEVGRGWRA